ncbi:MAG: M55 family metallopeptidase [Promethearchaeota archaeon]
MTKQVFILTDLEGVAHVTRFKQTREKGPENEYAKGLLTKELNAVIKGINEFDPGIDIHVWDGHGPGGLVPDQILPIKRYLPPHKVDMVKYFRNEKIDAMAWVGQHAMSYTVHGNLCHTMSSRTVEYYELNGRLVGEFGLRAPLAGALGVPTIFLSGDDKACLEARQLIPEIVTVAVKEGTGWETANSLPFNKVYQLLKEGIKHSLSKTNVIKPYVVKEPVSLKIAKKGWQHIISMPRGGQLEGSRTITYSAPSMIELASFSIF